MLSNKEKKYMKAAQFSEYGGPSVLKVTEIDKPALSEGQVLVEVHAASLNPFDTKIREGFMKDFMPLELPVTLGGDFAGIVAEVSAGVTNVAVGDKVYGSANAVAGASGAFAEYVATSAGQVAALPTNTDDTEAAAVVLVGVSARQALVQHLNLQSGQKVFINGAGGIGAIAIMIAKHLGAYVATTAAADSAEDVKKLGADEVIDYTSQDFVEILRDYDAVFDTVGDAAGFARSLAILKKGGIAVTMGMGADQAKADEIGVTAISQVTKVTTESLNALTALIEDGVVTPQVGKVFPLDDVQAAFEARENGSVKGKIVLAI